MASILAIDYGPEAYLQTRSMSKWRKSEVKRIPAKMEEVWGAMHSASVDLTPSVGTQGPRGNIPGGGGCHDRFLYHPRVNVIHSHNVQGWEGRRRPLLDGYSTLKGSKQSRRNLTAGARKHPSCWQQANIILAQSFRGPII